MHLRPLFPFPLLCLAVHLLVCLRWHRWRLPNRAEPAGKYLLDLDDPSDRSTFMELLAIAFQGKGCFAPQPGTTILFVTSLFFEDLLLLNLTLCAAPRVDKWYDGSWVNHQIVVPDQPDEDEWVMPPKGLIEFSFASLMSTENAGEMNANEIEWLHNELNTPGKTERDRVGAIRAFCEGDNFLRYEAVEEILGMLPEDSRTNERCELVKQCFSRLTEPERAIEMLHMLTINERKQVEKKLGVQAIAFTKNNATGKYKLDLSKKPERDVCFRLIEINTAQQGLLQKMDNYYANRKGSSDLHAFEK
jgi:hypothetical protein